MHVVVVVHIYSPVTTQRHTLNIGRWVHFSLEWLLCALRNPHLVRSFLWSNVCVDFFKFLSTEFAACLKPPIRNFHLKASYRRTQQHDQGEGQTQIMQSGLLQKQRLCPLGYAADLHGVRCVVYCSFPLAVALLKLQLGIGYRYQTSKNAFSILPSFLTY